MSDFDRLKKYLITNAYTFCTCFDSESDTLQIKIETEKKETTLCYNFDEHGRFKKMFYSRSYCSDFIYNVLLDNVSNAQFSQIDAYYGGHKAKAKRE